MGYKKGQKATREELIEMYNLNEDEQYSLLDELLAIEEEVAEQNK